MTQLHRLNPLDHDRSGLQGSSAGWKTCHYDDHHHCYSMWCWIWCLVGYLNININITLNIAISYFLRYFSEEDDEDDLIGLWIDSSLMAWKKFLQRAMRIPSPTYHTTITLQGFWSSFESFWHIPQIYLSFLDANLQGFCWYLLIWYPVWIDQLSIAQSHKVSPFRRWWPYERVLQHPGLTFMKRTIARSEEQNTKRSMNVQNGPQLSYNCASLSKHGAVWRSRIPERSAGTVRRLHPRAWWGVACAPIHVGRPMWSIQWFQAIKAKIRQAYCIYLYMRAFPEMGYPKMDGF